MLIIIYTNLNYKIPVEFKTFLIKFMYSKIPLIWHKQDWTGSR